MHHSYAAAPATGVNPKYFLDFLKGEASIHKYWSCKIILKVGFLFLSLGRSFFPQCSKPRTPLHMDGGLDHFFPNSILLDIAKDGFTIIWRLSKNMNFHKIWRLWLKNCARHAHFNFELLKGVAASFFELYPSNFSQTCIFYRQTNDVFTAKLYL